VTFIFKVPNKKYRKKCDIDQNIDQQINKKQFFFHLDKLLIASLKLCNDRIVAAYAVAALDNWWK